MAVLVGMAKGSPPPLFLGNTSLLQNQSREVFQCGRIEDTHLYVDGRRDAIAVSVAGMGGEWDEPINRELAPDLSDISGLNPTSSQTRQFELKV